LYVDLELLSLIIAKPSPIKRPNSYPANAPVIPITANPYFDNVIVVSASGSAFPIAIMVKPKYVLDKFVIIPIIINNK